jgi:hypothetical protein
MFFEIYPSHTPALPINTKKNKNNNKKIGNKWIPRKHKTQRNYMKIADLVKVSLYMRDNE